MKCPAKSAGSTGGGMPATTRPDYDVLDAFDEGRAPIVMLGRRYARNRNLASKSNPPCRSRVPVDVLVPSEAPRHVSLTIVRDMCILRRSMAVRSHAVLSRHRFGNSHEITFRTCICSVMTFVNLGVVAWPATWTPSPGRRQSHGLILLLPESWKG